MALDYLCIVVNSHGFPGCFLDLVFSHESLTDWDCDRFLPDS